MPLPPIRTIKRDETERRLARIRASCTIRVMAGEGYGIDDILVELRRQRLRVERDHVRRAVLGRAGP